MSKLLRAALGVTIAAVMAAGCSDSGTEPDDPDPDFDRLIEERVSFGRPSVSPLTAEAVFTTTEPVSVTVTVLGEVPLQRSFADRTESHRIPVVGLYPDRMNEVELRLTTDGGVTVADTFRLETGPLPDFLPEVEVGVADPSRMEEGLTLSSLSIGRGGEGRFLSHPIAFDHEGTIRWYMDLSAFGGLVYMVEQLRNGNLVLGHGQSVYEYDLLGNKKSQWDFPGYLFHHDVIEKPDGDLVVAAQLADGPTVEDQVLEIDRETGGVLTVWDFREILDQDRTAYIENEVDWLHMNAVWWDSTDETLIVSARNQSAVAKVTRSGEVVWILSAHRGWEGGFEERLLTAVDGGGQPYAAAVQDGEARVEGFDWPWGQHAPMVLPNGNLLLFDNGLNRNFRFTPAGGGFSRGVEYAIDEEAGTVREVWQYGAERGAAYFSPIISDVDVLPETGNRLVMPGLVNRAEAFVTELSGDEVVFEATVRFANAFNTGGEGWGQFDLVYRSERIGLR